MSKYLRHSAQALQASREASKTETEPLYTSKTAALLHWINNLSEEQRQQTYRMIMLKELAPRLQENQIAKVLIAHGFTKSRKETAQGFIRVWQPPFFTNK